MDARLEATRWVTENMNLTEEDGNFSPATVTKLIEMALLDQSSQLLATLTKAINEFNKA